MFKKLKSIFNPNNFKRPGLTFIVPTWLGGFFGVFLFLFFLVAYFYENNLLYLYVFWLGTLGFWVMWLTNANLKKLKAHITLPSEFFADQAVSINLISAPDSIRSRSVEIMGKTVDLEPGGTYQIKGVAFSRGFKKRHELRVDSEFPLGLLHSWRFIESQDGFYVFPKRVDHFSRMGLTVGGGLGDELSTDLFVGFKRWTEYDSYKSINWKIYAKTKLRLKTEYERMEDKRLYIDFEMTRALQGFEQRLEQLSFWISQLANEKMDFQLQLPTGLYSHSTDDLKRALKEMSVAKEEDWT